MTKLRGIMNNSRWKPETMAKYVYNKIYNLDKMVNCINESPVNQEYRLKHVAVTLVDDIIKNEGDLDEIDYWIDVKKEIRFMYMKN